MGRPFVYSSRLSDTQSWCFCDCGGVYLEGDEHQCRMSLRGVLAGLLIVGVAGVLVALGVAGWRLA